MSIRQLSEQEQLRRKSLEELIKLGVNPYPPEEYVVNTNAATIKKEYDAGNNNLQDVAIAGRLMSRRIMGSASFVELQDETGRIQLYFRRDDICEDEDKTVYNTIFKKL